MAVEFGKSIPTCREKLQEILVEEGVARAPRSPDIAIGLLKWFLDNKHLFMFMQIVLECVKHYMGNSAVMDVLFSIMDDHALVLMRPFLSECLTSPSCVDMWRAVSDEQLCDFLARQGPLHCCGCFSSYGVFVFDDNLYLKIAQAWTQVLDSRPEHVVRAWMGMQHSWIKDFVLFTIAEKALDGAAPSSQECLEAVLSSVRAQESPHVCWAEACFSALAALWPARCSSSVALDLLPFAFFCGEVWNKASKLCQVSKLVAGRCTELPESAAVHGHFEVRSRDFVGS